MKFASCHNDRKLFCKGLCKPCYKQQYNTLGKRQSYNSKYYQDNKEQIQINNKAYNQNHQTQLKIYQKNRYQNKKQEIQDKIRTRYQNNKKQYNTHSNQYKNN